MVFIKLFIMGDYQHVTNLRNNVRSGTVLEERTFRGPEGDAEVILAEELPFTPEPDIKMSESDPLYMAYAEHQNEMREQMRRVQKRVIKPKKKMRSYLSKDPSIKGSGKIVIIIDDLGMNRKWTREVIGLKAPITSAFLPYAPKLKNDTQTATNNGHELIIHTPMEPMSKTIDPGPIALMDDMSETELETNLSHIFKSFEGYTGINNHMGSRLTQNSKAMRTIMNALAARGLYFVDSKTIANSVAGQEAMHAGVPFAQRDVFLDHEDNAAFVQNALAKLERVAKTKGIAIAIGHPKKHTVTALKQWLPTLKERGLEIIPASKAVYVQQTKTAAVPVKKRQPIGDPDVSKQLLLTLPQIEPATY